MENIDHMGKNTLENLAAQNLSAEGKRKLSREIISAMTALACLLAGWIYSMIFPQKAVIAALIYVVGIVVESAGIFSAAIRGVIGRNLTNAMEILVAIAILACFFDGQYQLAILIPVILNLVHFFEERSIMGGREVIDGLRRMQVESAILLGEDGSEMTVDAKQLLPGQCIIVKPGAAIPIDGKVVRGESNVDQKSLTGESLPQAVTIGDAVYAGTINLDGVLRVEVTCAYTDTSFSKILDMLEQSETISIPESRLLDRFMGYYIPLILTIAAAVALITNEISSAIAILVVSCPCGQMLVSSAPMIAALAASTKRGVLIKNSKFIEELTQIDTVVFDKTGTVTAGSLSVSACIPVEGVSSEEVFETAAVVACDSLHPVARAVMTSLASYGDYTPARDWTIRELPGKGMCGLRGDEEICFGSAVWFVQQGFVLPEQTAHTGPVNWVAKNGKLLGSLCFDDTLRPEAPDVIRSLGALGIEHTVMLTGDRRESAEQICAAVGIDETYAQLLPEDKQAHVRQLRGEGEMPAHRVLVVGDGINDAPALKEADVGIAMGAMGSDTAIQSADIALMNNNLDNIPFVIGVAKKTRSIIYQNLVLSFLISFTMIILSAFGIITALIGAVLHNLGAFVVLLNSSRILKEKE